jgi:ADP-ribosyl-[dinitrogen reductase] hydrolase
MKTSLSDPLRIAAVSAPGIAGVIGLTLCPGKKDPARDWDRDLDIDLTVIQQWGAEVVVTLVEHHELGLLHVLSLPDAVARHRMRWVHLPIRDVSVPDQTFEARWATTGFELRNLLRRGGSILIHCRGGLGRAGTIAARLLVELGMDAQSAIDAIRHVRPGAIETHEQEMYVLGCRPIMEEQAQTAVDGATDRALGCLLGLAVGDAIGTTLEFSRRDAHPPLTDMIGGGPFRLQPGEWTDDMSMALCLADSLIACGGLDQRDLMERFVRWWREGYNSHNGRCFDIGITTRQALQRFLDTGDPIAGSTNANTAGNGSIMRLAPVALRWVDDREQAVSAARAQSVTTHGTPAAIEGCALLAGILVETIATGDKASVLRRRSANESSIAAIAAGSWRGKERHSIRSSGYVVDTLEAALWCVDRTSGFSDAVLLAANLADDADTVAAVTGQIAGALWGRSAIPRHWLDRLAWREEIENKADRLLALQSNEQRRWRSGEPGEPHRGFIAAPKRRDLGTGGRRSLTPEVVMADSTRAVWDGITRSETVGVDSARIRQELATAARSYNWPSVIKILPDYA